MKDHILIYLIGIKLYYTFLIHSNYLFSFSFSNPKESGSTSLPLLIHVFIVATIKFVSLEIVILNDNKVHRSFIN